MTNWELDLLEKVQQTDTSKRGTLKAIFEEIASKHGISVHTVRNAYYKKIKDEVVEVSKQYPYKIGQIVEVEITRIVHYGAFVKTTDGLEFKGLIHISEIADTYVDSIYDFFDIGDRVPARVKSYYDGKLSLSTKGLVSPKIATIQDTSAKEKLEEFKRSLENNGQAREDENEDDIIKFLNNIVGIVSPQAMEYMNKLISEYGKFKFTVAMAKVSQGFVNDLGYHFMREVEHELRSGFL